MAPKKKAVATMKKNEVAVQETALPEALAMLAECAGAGFETVAPDDLGTPFLNVLCGQSPQIKPTNPKYIEGAEEGMIFNSVTHELFNELEVVVCGYEKAFVEWKPNRGGYAGKHKAGDITVQQAIRNEKNQLVTGQGNDLSETAVFSVLAKDSNGMWSPAIINLKGTQLKTARNWMYLLSNAKLRLPNGVVKQAPLFMPITRLGTVPQNNDLGDWVGWTIAPSGKNISDLPEFMEVFTSAKAIHAIIEEQGVEVDFDKEAEVSNSAPAQGATEDMPY